MSFTVKKLERVTLSAKIAIPGGDSGVVKVHIKYLGRRKARKYLESAAAGAYDDRRVIEELVLDCEGFKDESGAEIAFSDAAAREQLLDNPHILGPIRDAVFAEVTGGGYARAALEKN